MKRSIAIVASVAALLFAANTNNALAKDKEVTLSGEAKCAKCMLKEGKECQTVIQVEKNGKTRYVSVSPEGKVVKRESARREARERQKESTK